LYLPKSRELEAARAFFFSFRAAACVHFSFDTQPSPCKAAQCPEGSNFFFCWRRKIKAGELHMQSAPHSSFSDAL
jgi:hypothetical protein